MAAQGLPFRVVTSDGAPTMWRWVLGGSILGILTAVGVYAPASLLAAAVEIGSSRRLQLDDAHGTFWAGSARLRLSGGENSRDNAFLPGHVMWQVRPSWGALNLQLNASCCTPKPLKGRLLVRAVGVVFELADGESQWPTAMLAGLGAPWNTVRPEANLQLATHGLSLQWLQGHPVLSGRAELTALALSSRLSMLKPLGSYRVTFTGGNPAVLELATLEGALQFSGRGHWMGPRLKFEGLASSDAEHEAVLSNLLNIIGRRDGVRSFISLG